MLSEGTERDQGHDMGQDKKFLNDIFLVRITNT